MKKQVLLLLLFAFALTAAEPSDPEQSNILHTREAVWRAWFADDEPTLNSLLPEETVAISAGDTDWKNKAAILKEAREFKNGGGKLIQLQFGRTIIQRYGDSAFVYSAYVLRLFENGKESTYQGRATEVFVRRNGHWINPGWHTDSHQ